MAKVSIDENQEEANTPRDDLLTDGDILVSPIEFEQNMNINDQYSLMVAGHEAQEGVHSLNYSKKLVESNSAQKIKYYRPEMRQGDLEDCEDCYLPNSMQTEERDCN